MALMKSIYKLSFIQKMESLLPIDYNLNQYYPSKINSNQYVMRNSKGYFHIMGIVKNEYGFTFNHYRIDKSETLKDTGEHYSYFKTLEEIRNNIENNH